MTDHDLYPNGHGPFCPRTCDHPVHDAYDNRTPVQRWGTCCPHDPECEHSFLSLTDLTRHMHMAITDEQAAELEGP